jgi:hypothetical protein
MVMDPLMIRCGVPAQEKRGNASIGVPPFLFRGHPCLAHVVIVYHQEPVTSGEPEVTRTLSSS